MTLLTFISFRKTEKSGSLKVTLTGMRNDKGTVLVGLYKTENGFPFDATKAFKGAKAEIKNGNAEVDFEDIPSGVIAIAALHDEDNNMQMARKPNGLPDEEYGFSNDAKATFGPPKFDKASFEHTGDQVISIKMKI
ncbi:DUF2141 domain-containing protein [Pinibacter soli]|uniref:DUF2141 domain-containing protein n=1 Tax=Pinibacter soli TaxID=3044211 RepID=A0ABT6RCX7_9BACT|nr:DUF2141 domain-containing protein [Pinibacter soli]MDI3320433.1 DUF2141 domain-containing protein [Pinibacter soli]